MNKLLLLLLSLSLNGQVIFRAQNYVVASVGMKTRLLTVDHTQVPNTDQTNFATLVFISSSTIKSVAHGGHVQSSAGADILFFSDSGSTMQIPSEIDYYDPVNGVLWAWVQVTLSHTTNTLFYVSYGETMPPSRTGDPWDSNFLSVWHGGTGSAIVVTDSTSNGNNGNLNNSPTAVAGKIAGGIGLALSGPSYSIGTNVINQAHATFSAWVFVPTSSASVGGWLFGFADGAGSPTADKYFRVASSGGIQFFWHIFDGGSEDIDSSVVLDQWVYLVGTCDGTTMTLYVNGASTASKSAGNSFTGYSSPNLLVGDGGGGQTAIISYNADEIHFSNIARSADWIATEYNNQNNPGSFITVGPEF